MSTRALVVFGSSPLLAVASAIASRERGPDLVRTVALAIEHIGAFDPAEMPEASGAIEAFAAIPEAALNFARFDLWSKLKLRGLRCATLVHATATIDPTANLGENVLIGAGAIIEPGVVVGRGTIVGAGAILGAESEVRDWCWIAQGVSVGAGSSIGANSVIGTGVQFAAGTTFPGPGVVDVAGAYRGSIAPGTFISPEFPFQPARMMLFARGP